MTWLLFKYCGAIRIYITLNSHPSPPLPFPTLPSLLSLPSLPPSLPLVTQPIHCPFQPKQSPSCVLLLYVLSSLLYCNIKFYSLYLLNDSTVFGHIISEFCIHLQKIRQHEHMYHITAHIYRHCVSITLITVKTMAMWHTVIRSGQVVPAMKAMVPAKAILNKNPALCSMHICTFLHTRIVLAL